MNISDHISSDSFSFPKPYPIHRYNRWAIQGWSAGWDIGVGCTHFWGHKFLKRLRVWGFLFCSVLFYRLCCNICSPNMYSEYSHIKIALTTFQESYWNIRRGRGWRGKGWISWPTICIYSFSTLGAGVSLHSFPFRQKEIKTVDLGSFVHTVTEPPNK